MPSDRGTGYHVNVELPDGKFVFCQASRMMIYFADAVRIFIERRLHDGDIEATKWSMKVVPVG